MHPKVSGQVNGLPRPLTLVVWTKCAEPKQPKFSNCTHNTVFASVVPPQDCKTAQLLRPKELSIETAARPSQSYDFTGFPAGKPKNKKGSREPARAAGNRVRGGNAKECTIVVIRALPLGRRASAAAATSAMSLPCLLPGIALSGPLNCSMLRRESIRMTSFGSTSLSAACSSISGQTTNTRSFGAGR